MARFFLHSLRAPARLRWRDLWLTVLPLLIWAGSTQMRPFSIRTSCAAQPTPCTRESVPAPDRPTLGMESPEADAYSYLGQNLSGTLAAALPVAWHAGLWLARRSSLPVALASLGTDLAILVQTVAINVMLTETTRLVSQRPRPFVYSDPLHRGLDPAHYTSFYSGHTSFSAAAGTGLLIVLASRGAPDAVLVVLGLVVSLLVTLTGFFRMLAGRHFLTDVIAGAVAGVLVALGVAILHRTRRRRSPVGP
jgi:membrane-associated phospholipid phosphatase